MTKTEEVLREQARLLDDWRRYLGGIGQATTVAEIHGARSAVGQTRAAAEEWTRLRPPEQTIWREERAYLQRWWLERTRERCVYLHRFLAPDPDHGLHDHPADSASLLLAGRQIEHWREDGADASTPPRVRVLDEGAFVWRPAAHAHQLYPAPGSGPPLTLFVFGPRVRSWGFWVPDGRGGLYLDRRPPRS